jgi:uncharacterized protein
MLMSDLLEEGLRAFNEGRFYDAHEIWEDLWRATPDVATRRFYQGLIQAAVGLHHLSQGNRIGAGSQLGKSVGNLETGDGSESGLDIGGIVIELRQLRQSLENDSAMTPRLPRIARLQ